MRKRHMRTILSHRVKPMNMVCRINTESFKEAVSGRRGTAKSLTPTNGSESSIHPGTKEAMRILYAQTSPHQSHDREEFCIRSGSPARRLWFRPHDDTRCLSLPPAANVVRAMPLDAGATLGGYPSARRKRNNDMQRAADVAPS
ncbi:hypothetical protein PSPO01_02712 [Paraphaeosphaeria sporulosa]